MRLTGSIMQEDIQQIVSDGCLPWGNMANASVLVTGATGLIGFAAVHALRAVSDKHGLRLCILGAGRKKDRLSLLTEERGIDAAIEMDIRDPLPEGTLPERVDYIIHCAAITKSADMRERPVDVITTAVDGTRNILNVAKEKNCRGMVYLSSMEVYGQAERAEVCETDLGYLDLSSPRSCYPESKRLCESMCVGYAAQYGVPVKIARLAQTFGVATPQDDPRVFAQVARSARSGKDIILHTAGKSRGNYCYTFDAISGLLHILLKGNSGEAYNVANPDASATIREMAEIVANEVCGGRINVRYDVAQDLAKRGYAPEVGYRLNTDKLCALGWQPRYGLADMYKRMLRDWSGE